MKKHIITISGDLASGKSTVTDILKNKLGYEIYRNGEYVRSLAKEMNMDITTFNNYVTNHPEIDRNIELSASKYAEDHDNLIVDARLGWYSIPYSFKIYLKVDIDESSKRAFNDPRRKSTESFSTIEEQKKDIIKRYNSENERFFNLYGVHKEDMNNYDLVVDTTNLTIDEVVDVILTKYNEWLNK